MESRGKWLSEHPVFYHTKTVTLIGIIGREHVSRMHEKTTDIYQTNERHGEGTSVRDLNRVSSPTTTK